MATPKRRRLEDLYVVGREMEFDDQKGGGAVVVWLQKLNPLETERVIRRAGAEKAKLLMVRNNTETDEWLESYTDVDEFGDRETLIEYLISEDLANYRDAREAENSFEDEWKKDGYLQGLRDAWIGEPDQLGLKDAYAEGPGTDADPNEQYAEAEKLLAELTRFDDQVKKLVDGERKKLHRDWATKSDEDIRRAATERFLTVKADMAWGKEFRRMQVWLSVRDPEDHDVLYWEKRSQVEKVDPRIVNALASAYSDLEVDPQEGKDLPPIPTSLAPSERSGEAETAEPSGPLALVP